MDFVTPLVESLILPNHLSINLFDTIVNIPVISSLNILHEIHI